MYYSLLDILSEPFAGFNGNLSYDNVSSKGDVYLAKIILPGVKKSEISIKANTETLTVKVKDKIYKKINLSNLVDLKTIKSKHQDGILEITLPKKEVSDSVDIDIK